MSKKTGARAKRSVQVQGKCHCFHIPQLSTDPYRSCRVLKHFQEGESCGGGPIELKDAQL